MSTFTSSEESVLPSLLKEPTVNKPIQLKSVGATTPTQIDNDATTNYNKWGLLTSDDEEYLALMKKFSPNDTRTNESAHNLPDTKLAFENDLSSSPPPQVQPQKLMQPQQLNAFFHPGNLKDTKSASDSKVKRRKYNKKPVKKNMNLLKFLGMPELVEFDGKLTLKIGKANASLIQTKLKKSTLAGHVTLKIGKTNALYIENGLTRANKDSDSDGAEIEASSISEADRLQPQDQHQEQSAQLPDSKSDNIQSEQNDFKLSQQSRFSELEPLLITSTFNQQLTIPMIEQQSALFFSKQQESIFEPESQQTVIMPEPKQRTKDISLPLPALPQYDYSKQSIIDQPKAVYNALPTNSLSEKPQTNKAVDNSFQMINDAAEQKMCDTHESSQKLEDIHSSILDQCLHDNHYKRSYIKPSLDQATLKPSFPPLGELPTEVLDNQPISRTTSEILAIAIANDSGKHKMVVSFKYRKPSSYIVKLKYKSNQQNSATSASNEATIPPPADLTSKMKMIGDIVKPQLAKKPIHPFFLKRTGTTCHPMDLSKLVFILINLLF
jgi:hypothetical protein